MEHFFKMLDMQLILVVYIIVGIITYKAGYITDKNRQSFINFILNILMPAMIINSFKNVTVNTLMQGIVILVISLAIYGMNYILGRFIFKKYKSAHEVIMRYGLLINNASFSGLPIVVSIYGEKGLLLASMFLIPARIFMFSAGITILSGEKSGFKQTCLKLIKSPPIIGVIVGLIRGLCQIQLPTFVDTAIVSMSNALSPLALIAIGTIVATMDVRKVLAKGVIYFSMWRLIFVPVIVVFLLKLLNCDPLIIGVSLILTSMPAGTSTALLSAQYNGDETYASKIVLVSTILSIVTSPIVMLLI